MATLLAVLGGVTDEQHERAQQKLLELGHQNIEILRINDDWIEQRIFAPVDANETFWLGAHDHNEVKGIIYTLKDESEGVWEEFLEDMPECAYFVVDIDGSVYYGEEILHSTS